jgi:hypothetical protein
MFLQWLQLDAISDRDTIRLENTVVRLVFEGVTARFGTKMSLVRIQ